MASIRLMRYNGHRWNGTIGTRVDSKTENQFCLCISLLLQISVQYAYFVELPVLCWCFLWNKYTLDSKQKIHFARVFLCSDKSLYNTVAYPGGFSGCPEPPPPGHDFFLIRGFTSLHAPTFTSHLNLRLLETPLETNSGYATDGDWSCWYFSAAADRPPHIITL